MSSVRMLSQLAGPHAVLAALSFVTVPVGSNFISLSPEAAYYEGGVNLLMIGVGLFVGMHWNDIKMFARRINFGFPVNFDYPDEEVERARRTPIISAA